MQNPTRRAYWIFPLDIRGQATFVCNCQLKFAVYMIHTIRAGKILKKATSPFGVVAGTRSIAAERMITYKTADQLDPWKSSLAVPLFSRPKMAKAIKSRYRAFWAVLLSGSCTDHQLPVGTAHQPTLHEIVYLLSDVLVIIHTARHSSVRLTVSLHQPCGLV